MENLIDKIELTRRMVIAREFENALADLWHRGLISGELHLGTGEEAVASAVTALLQEGDAVALDHRCTPVLALLGVDQTAMVKEMLGRTDGLCRGFGGHMHLMSKPHLAAASGIVGAAAPTGAGFALAAKRLRPGKLAVAFFGDGACNQGLVLESLNLSVAWKLPLVFVCKDNGWAITTRSETVTGGSLINRARAFDIPAEDVDGGDLAATYDAMCNAFDRVRRGKGPFFLLARCPRLDGHFLGDPLLRTADKPMTQGKEVFSKVFSSVLSTRGAGVGGRVASMARMTGLLLKARGTQQGKGDDPIVRARKALNREQQKALDGMTGEVRSQMRNMVEAIERGEACPS